MGSKHLTAGQSFLCDALRYVGPVLVLLSHAISFQYTAQYAPYAQYVYGNLGTLGISVSSSSAISHRLHHQRKLLEDHHWFCCCASADSRPAIVIRRISP